MTAVTRELPVPDSGADAATAGSGRWLAAVLAILAAVLAAGLFLPDLLGGDASQDAVMAMRMHLDGDWVHLVKNGRDYLDKPHLLFWSAMVGYRLFGVHDWSYRLVSVLVCVLGGWSTLRLGTWLYGRTVGRIAAVMFLTAQTILLGNHDVRMDALLTGFTAFGLWQLALYVDTGRLRPLLLGAAGVGLAFSSKGMIAVAVAGACLFFHVWARRAWRRLWSWRLAAGLAAFALAIAPVLVSYYLQFDLHPEKVIGGRTGVSGVKFILLGQSVERFTGARGEVAAKDHLFLYHSLLWAFLPWSLLAFAAWFDRLRELLRGRSAAFHGREQLTALGPLVAIGLLNFSRFKLPHYLNVFLPMLAIMTAAWVEERWREGGERTARRLEWTQRVVIGAVLALALVVNGWFFPPRSGWVMAGAVAIAALLAAALRRTGGLDRVWVPSAIAVLLLNFTLNASFYPQVARLEAGSHVAEQALRLGLDWSQTFFLGGKVHQPFQLYSGHLVPLVDVARVQAVLEPGTRAYALADEQGRRQVEAAGLEYRELLRSPDCRVTKLTLRMVRPDTRDAACPKAYLLELRR
jgi:4-amino-4-deoxy-L-arabinose transferase-like glycosyltransferase